MEDILTLTHATERDIDLLLVEELKCSAAFVQWFAARVATKVNVKIQFGNSEVTHSKRRMHNRREIDISLMLRKVGGAPTCLLIENKLDTGEQYRQAESYREEATVLVAGGNARAAFTVLVSPSAYAATNSAFSAKFDANISYEEISAFLAARVKEGGEIGARLQHRHQMFEQAITKARRGYEAVPVLFIEQFNAKYVALLRKEFPTLLPGPAMLKEGRPGESKTMIFAPAALPSWDFLPQMRIVHQLREGNVNVNFYGWGNHFTALAGPMASDLAGTPYRLVPTINKRANGNAGLMIVVETPPIDNLSGFDAQEDKLRIGMVAVDRLRAWIWANSKVIQRWASLMPTAAK